MFTINNSFELRDKGRSDSKDTALLPRHRWYVLKEAFSPELVMSAINKAEVKEGELIIDPFSGSGTTALTSSLNGFKGIGIEVNPFLAFVAETKLISREPNTINKYLPLIKNSFNKQVKSHLEGISTFSETNNDEKWLFNTSVLRTFESGWQAVQTIPSTTKKIFQLCLIGAAMDVCNAKPDGKCLRYKKKWMDLDYNEKDFKDAFEKRICNVIEDINQTTLNKSSNIVHADCRKYLETLVDEKFKLCVTSPPYLNSFDYSDVYRPEMFLGRFIKDNNDLMAVRMQTMRSHIQASWKAPERIISSHLLQESLSKIIERHDLLWSNKIPSMILAYFEDWDNILRNLDCKSEKNAQLWIVVSTSAYAGIEIPVDLIIADIATKHNWYLQEIGVLRYIRTSGQHWNNIEDKAQKPSLRESVIILRKQI